MKSILVTLVVLISGSLISQQANVSPHSHKHGGEREVDGAFSPRDHSHFDDDDEHNADFDHEAILGSAKEAEEFDHLPPEEAKKRLAILLEKMDLDSDKFISSTELKQWIIRSFKSLSQEESKEKLAEVDLNKDGEVTWNEYKAETYGLENDVDSIFSGKEHAEEQRLMKNDKELFDTADLNKDGKLDEKEFLAFTHPEEAPHMLDIILKQTLEEKDLNKDGSIDFQEYIGDRGQTKDKTWLLAEKEKFDHELDSNADGLINSKEILNWVLPSNSEIADEEVDHLFASADDDHDSLLSFEEVLAHHDVFVGSEATDYGDHLNNIHRFQDEL